MRVQTVSPPSSQPMHQGAAAVPKPLRAEPASAALWSLLVALLAWPLSAMPRAQGLDGSWQVALDLAARERLDFGRDVVFTYGPLGWLARPTLVWWPTAALSLLSLLLVTWGLAALLTNVLRSAGAGLVPSLLGAYLMCRFVAVSHLPVFTALVTAVALLWVVRGLPPWLSHRPPEALAALAALCLLVKTDLGLIATVTAAVLIVDRAWTGGARGVVRDLGRAAASGTIVLAIGGALQGTPPWVLPEYLRYSLSVASGYTDAMAGEEPGRLWEFGSAAALTLLLTLALYRGVPDDRRWPALAVLLLPSFFALKHGFVRHDTGHALELFLWFLVVGAAVWSVSRSDSGRDGTMTYAGALASVGLALAALSYVDAGRLVLHERLDPRPPIRALGNQAATLLVPARLNEERTRLKAEVLADAGLSPAQFDETRFRGLTYDVLPLDTSLIWALELDWRPAPVFQSYSAYTATLDQLGAETYSGQRSAPDRVLFRDVDTGVDDRPLQTESPRALLALMCHYAVERQLGTWWELSRRAESRCGAAVEVSRTTVAAGQPVNVPRADPGQLLTVRIEASVGGAHRLANFVFRTPHARMTIDGRRHLLLREVAGAPLMMSVPDEEPFLPLSLPPGQRAAARLAVTGFAGDVTYVFEQTTLRPAGPAKR
jgi:hypothetical protein